MVMTLDYRPAPVDYRRRRLVAVGLLFLLLAAAVIVGQRVEAGAGGGPLTATGAAASASIQPAQARVWVVRPGDTLWSIAARLDPKGDERPLVDRLSAEVHGQDLYPGEVLVLP